MPLQIALAHSAREIFVIPRGVLWLKASNEVPACFVGGRIGQNQTGEVIEIRHALALQRDLQVHS